MVLCVAFMSLATADGFIMPRPPHPMPPDFPHNPLLNVKYHHVDVEINDPSAVTTIDQVFVNPYHRELEAEYIFPIPENASISSFTAWLGGTKMSAELLDAKQARSIYEEIVRKRRDPALLEYADRGMYRMRIYPIPPNGEVRVKIEYRQTLKSDYGNVEYIYPLNTEKYSGSRLEDCKVDVNIKSFEKIGAVYCPSHITKNKRISDNEYQVTYYEEHVKPDKDLVLYFTRQNKDFGFHLASYRAPGDNNGYFMGILSPPLEKNMPDVPKNVIFILDSSGSMKGEKFDQAMGALKFVLLDLNSGDKFNVIDYDDDIRPYRDILIEATESNVSDAIDYARKRYEASGGTNIYDALETACNMIPSNDHPTYILFLTDGLPTVGTRDINKIVQNTNDLNNGRARLFTFGVGFDVNAHLLDQLSEDNNGVPEYVLPDEDIEVKVSRLAEKISRPALTNISLEFAGAATEHVYPNPLPDLFYGSEVIITGRFDKTGVDQAVLKGKIGGQAKTYEFPVEFKDGSFKDEFIALLWANRRIGFLTQQIRLHGDNNELIDEIVSLSKKYGIVTDYTSFLVTGDERFAADDIIYRGGREYLREQVANNAAHYNAPTGDIGVNQSKNLGSMQSSSNAYYNYSVDLDKKAVTKQFSQIGAQNFINMKGNWVQGDLKEDKFDMEIKNFSPAYFQILENAPSLGRYLGQGDQVRLKIGSQVVQFSNSGQETLNKQELKLLFPHL